MGLITISKPKAHQSEAFRTLRTNLSFSSIDKNIQTIVVTSSVKGEGKSTVSTNVAVTFAQAGKKTLLIDCDFRRPNLHHQLVLTNDIGLSNSLVDNVVSTKYIKPTGIDNLDVLCSGPIPPNPSELLSSQKMKNLIEEVKGKYEMIILDSSPVGIVTDSAILSTLADGTLFVVAAGETHIKVVKRAKDLLEKVNANLIGVVLNKVKKDRHGKGYTEYYYYEEPVVKKSNHKRSKKKRGEQEITG